MKKHIVERFIKSPDLNDHGTLFAGLGASWMVEASFLAAGAADCGKHQIVCRCIKNLDFLKPVPLGTMIHMESYIQILGNTSIQVHCDATDVLDPNIIYMKSDIVYVTTDDEGHKVNHGIQR